jgi:micrococcal nuclease
VAARRGTWKGLVLLGAIVSVLVLGAIERPERAVRPAPRQAFPGADTGPEDPGGGGVGARVLEITDGDTIVVELADGTIENVRYIGIDTPESTPNQPLECFGHEAAEANRGLVEGTMVGLEFGPERRDDYGRLLAYVRAGGVLVNARLARLGFARTLTIAPNDARAPLFGRLERAAARTGRGLWGACS